MTDRAPVRDQFEAETAAIAGRVGSADLLVGILAQDHAGSVAAVAGTVAAGLTAHLPDGRACLLLLDAGSRDGTAAAIQAWLPRGPKGLAVEFLRIPGPPAPGRALRALLEAGRRLAVSACAYVHADLIGIAPDWLPRLFAPLLAGHAERVFPAFSRSVTEGTLTTNLLAPLARALYGRRIQQPLGGLGALDGALLAGLLDDPAWETTLGPHGIELWLAVEPMAAGRKLVEVHLGQKRVAVGPSQPDLPTILSRAVGPFFALLGRYQGVWTDVRGSVPVPCLGDPPGLAGSGAGVEVERMVRAFRAGVKDLLPVWEQIMPEETLGQLYPLGLPAPDEFEFPAPLWARVVCDFALAFHERRLPQEHLLRAMTPLYLGRVAGFLREAQEAPGGDARRLLEAIGEAFEREVVTLQERWR